MVSDCTKGKFPAARFLNNLMPQADRNNATATDEAIKISVCVKIALNNRRRLAPSTACSAKVLCCAKAREKNKLQTLTTAISNKPKVPANKNKLK